MPTQEKLEEARGQHAAAAAEASSTKQALADRELLMPMALASGDAGEDEVNCYLLCIYLAVSMQVLLL